MENINKYKINSLPLKLKKLGDLLYHEGALLSDFIDTKNSSTHYLYKWSDIDEKCNRWMVFKVISGDLLSHLEGKLSILELIQQNQFVYFVDLDNDINEVNAFCVSNVEIHDDYLPSTESFFDEKHYEEYALTLKKTLEENESI